MYISSPTQRYLVQTQASLSRVVPSLIRLASPSRVVPSLIPLFLAPGRGGMFLIGWSLPVYIATLDYTATDSAGETVGMVMSSRYGQTRHRYRRHLQRFYQARCITHFTNCVCKNEISLPPVALSHYIAMYKLACLYNVDLTRIYIIHSCGCIYKHG